MRWIVLPLLFTTLTACETLTGARIGPEYDRSGIPEKLDYPPDLIGSTEAATPTASPAKTDAPPKTLKIERLRDEQGLYLIFDLPSTQTRARVDRALSFMGYNVMENEDTVGEWFVTPQPKTLEPGEPPPDPRDPNAGPRPLRMHLYADKQSSGTVLELVPEDEFHVGIRDEIERVTRRLAERLEQM